MYKCSYVFQYLELKRRHFHNVCAKAVLIRERDWKIGTKDFWQDCMIHAIYKISPSICALFNKSLRAGMVPDEWKLANIVPVYKKGDREHVENYRPISLLSLVSKVFERCVSNTIKDHVFLKSTRASMALFRGDHVVLNFEVIEHMHRSIIRSWETSRCHLPRHVESLR